MRKTIKAKVSEETNQAKIDVLKRIWRKWEKILKEKEEMEFQDFPLYHEESVFSYLKNENRHTNYISHLLWKDLSLGNPAPLKRIYFNIQKRDTQLVPFWASIPTKERRGGVKVPLEVPYRYYDVLEEWEVKDSELIRKGDTFWVHIAVEKEIETKKEYDGVLAIDLGIRHPAVGVAVGCSSVKPEFYGEKVREIRGKYFYLRRRLQKLGHDGALEKISGKEKRKVDDQAHKISRRIVDKAEEHDLCIVIGDVKDFRDSDWGKSGNRKLHSMISHKLKEYISYKAEEEGIYCEVVDESYTTKTCSRCGYERDSRPNKQFKCPECGYETHADINGAKNIEKRGLSKLEDTSIQVRGVIDQPEPLRCK